MVISPIFIYVSLFILFTILVVWVVTLEFRLKRVFRGSKVKDLEDLLRDMSRELDRAKIFREQIVNYLEAVEERLKKSVRKIKTVRFNPFENAGSNQSFATSFLDEEGNGVVISSLYSREKVGIYAKPIKRYSSEYPLTEEETSIIEESKKSEPVKKIKPQDISS